MPDYESLSTQSRDHIITILASLSEQRPTSPSSIKIEAHYRDLYQQGFINDANLLRAFAQYPELHADQSLISVGSKTIARADIYRVTMLYAEDERPSDYATDTDQALWQQLLISLKLPVLSETCFESLSLTKPDNNIHNLLRQLANSELDQLLAEFSITYSLLDIVYLLSGENLLIQINQQLQQALIPLNHASCEWTTSAHQQLDLYGLWRILTRQDASLFLHQLPDWQNIIAQLPEDAISAIALQLHCFDIPPTQWMSYLHKITDELPLINAENLADLLAIRLTLDRLWLNQVCHDLWKIEAKISTLNNYLRKNLSEFWVRFQLYQGNLPEDLSLQAEALITRSGSERFSRSDWQQLADNLTLRQHCLTNSRQLNKTAKRLYFLCQKLDLSDKNVQEISIGELLAVLPVVDDLTRDKREKIWQSATAIYFQQTYPEYSQTDKSLSWQTILVEFIANDRVIFMEEPSDIIEKSLKNPCLDYAVAFFLAPILLFKMVTQCFFIAQPPKKTTQLAPLSKKSLSCLVKFLQRVKLTKPTSDFIVLLEINNDPIFGNNSHQLVTLLNYHPIREQLSIFGIFIPLKTWFILHNYDTIRKN